MKGREERRWAEAKTGSRTLTGGRCCLRLCLPPLKLLLAAHSPVVVPGTSVDHEGTTHAQLHACILMSCSKERKKTVIKRREMKKTDSDERGVVVSYVSLAFEAHQETRAYVQIPKTPVVIIGRREWWMAVFWTHHYPITLEPLCTTQTRCSLCISPVLLSFHPDTTPAAPAGCSSASPASQPAASFESHSHQGRLKDGRRSDEGSRGRLAGVSTGSAAAPSVRRRYVLPSDPWNCIRAAIQSVVSDVVRLCRQYCIVKLFAAGRPCYSQSHIPIPAAPAAARRSQPPAPPPPYPFVSENSSGQPS